jgi:hypothetical protein
MKAVRILSRITLGLGVLSFLCLVGYYLALHDIFFDYVSPKVLYDHGLTPGLPAWTLCPGEWQVVSIGLWTMVAFHVMLLVTLIAKRKQAKGTLA